MKMRRVQELSGCKYLEVNETGLVIEQGGVRKTIEVCMDHIYWHLFFLLFRVKALFLPLFLQCDTVVTCAGQEPNRSLYNTLKSETSPRAKLFMIGGAHEAGELDAKRAIDQGTR